MRYAMIMAGGAGTRLWPLSRRGTPKQFLPLIAGGAAGEAPRSLLQVAAARLEGLIPPERRYICSGEAFRAQVLEALPGLADDRYLGEPEGRDSVNAVGFAAAVLEKLDPDAIFCTLTADHIIEPVDEFQRRIDVGFKLVEQDASRLVTFSIKPTFPATGYGYVQRGAPIAGFEGGGAFEVQRFVEKPDEATAKRYIADGGFGWNSGMFVWSARTFMRCLEAFLPENARGLREIQAAWGTPRQAETIARVYPGLKKTSVDYGVMEPATEPRAAEGGAGVRVATVSMDLRWLDVGTWPSYGETLTPDEAGNRAAALAPAAAAYVADSSKNLVVNSDPGHAVALVGCEGLVVVHTPEATLVMPAERAEQLKKLHGELPEGLR